MAEKITDQQLVDELRRYGETVALPLKLGKRAILFKKLNHLKTKAKSDQASANKSINRGRLDVLSSDDSDFETTGQSDRQRSKIVSGVSKSIRRRSTASAAPISPPKPKKENKRLSLGRPTLRSRKSDIGSGGGASPSRVTKLEERRTSSRLYPDLNDFSATQSPTGGYRRDDTFESSDSDLDESTYEVENKSVNTTFTIESNNSFLGGRSPTGRANKSKSNTSYSNHVSPKRNLNSSQYSANHTPNKRDSDAKKQYKLYPEHVSGGLLIIVGGFFLVLAVSYIFVRRDVIVSWYTGSGDMSKPVKSTYLLCLDNNENKKNEKCYPKKVVEKTMVVIRDVFDVLSSRKGSVLCGKAEEWEQSMAVDDFRRYVANIKNNQVDASELFNSCLDHILLNSHWNIRLLGSDGEDATDVQSIVHLESTVPSMSLVCRLQRSVYKVIWAFFVVLLGFVLVYLLLKYFKWRNLAKEKELKHVYSMVDEIIDILKRHHDLTQDESSSQQYLAVQHVRDQLLPPSRRRELQPIWEKAVQFIEKNESRIRLEEQTIEGEDFRVWRWIHNSPNGGKVWQGQAFGEHSDDNSNNTVMICPTPCLKIRNMFDADVEGEEGDWEVNIEDALLEKCKNIKSIFHVYVDKDSKEGCVYVKCSTCEAAGRARQALHGWWFDRRLVTVRYLKLDYYHNRFPDSASMNTPLIPSTNQMSSLSQPFYRSSLEMT